MVYYHQIDKVQLTFHLAAAAINMSAAIIFLFFRLELSDTIKKLSFFTNFNQACVALFYAKVLINDLQALIHDRKQPYSQQVINTHKLLLGNSAAVTLIFWGAYMIDHSLVLSRNAQKEISMTLLILFHGGNFAFLAIDELWYFRRTQAEVNSHIPVIQGYIYLSIVFIYYLSAERFPYPFMKHLPSIINFLILAILIFLLTKFYRYLSDFLNEEDFNRDED